MSEHGHAHGYPASPSSSSSSSSSSSQPFKTVGKQIDKISTILKGATEDWKPRFSSLVELERLVADLSIYNDFKQYFNDTTLATLTQPLQIQMLDLRSEIVRQASSTISCIAQHVNINWTRAANKLIPTLLQAATAANMVIKGYAHTCLNNVVAACQSTNIAQTILTEIKTCKSELGRQTCMELVREMVLLWSPRMYRRHVSLLEEAILFGLRGASLPTRVAAAGCYWAYADSQDEQNASAAVKLLASMDARLKKFIATQKDTAHNANQEIKHTYKQHRNGEEGDQGDDAASDAGSDLSHMSDVDAKSPRPTLTPLHTSQSTPAIPAAASASKRTSTTKVTSRPTAAASTGHGIGTMSTTTSNATTTTTTGAAATRIQALIKGRRARTMIKERVGTGSLVSVGMRVRVLADSEMFPVSSSSSSSDTEAAHAGASAYGVVLFIGERDGKTGEWAQVQLDPEQDADAEKQKQMEPRTMFTRRHNLQPESWRPQDDDTFAAVQAAAEAGAPISATYTPERTKKPATLRISKSTSAVSRHRSRVGDWNLGGSGSNSASASASASGSGSAAGSVAGSRSASRPSSRVGSRNSSPASSAPSSPRQSTRSALPYATASLRKSTGSTITSTTTTASAPPSSRSSSFIQPATATSTATGTSSAFIDSLFDIDNDPPYPVEYAPTRSASNSTSSQPATTAAAYDDDDIQPSTQNQQHVLTQGIIQRAQSEPTPAPTISTSTSTSTSTSATSVSASGSPTPSHTSTPSRSPSYSPTPSPRTTAADIAAHRSGILPRSHIPHPTTHDMHQHHHQHHQHQHPTHHHHHHHHHATSTTIQPIINGFEQTQTQLSEQFSNLIRDHKTHVQQSAIHLQQLNLLLSVGRSSPDYSDRMITLLSDHLTKSSHLLESFTQYKLALSAAESAKNHKESEQDDFLEGHDNFAT